MRTREEINEMFEQLNKRSAELTAMSIEEWVKYRGESYSITGAMSTLNWILNNKTDEQFLKILK